MKISHRDRRFHFLFWREIWFWWTGIRSFPARSPRTTRTWRARRARRARHPRARRTTRARRARKAARTRRARRTRRAYVYIYRKRERYTYMSFKGMLRL